MLDLRGTQCVIAGDLLGLPISGEFCAEVAEFPGQVPGPPQHREDDREDHRGEQWQRPRAGSPQHERAPGSPVAESGSGITVGRFRAR
ncbi:hypothetical protein AB0M34_00435 [Nocardia sp. NPDC050193]